jgi:TonB family protein
MRENVKGTVILYAVIHSDGRVGDVRVLRGVDERLDRYAANALAQWKFQPATKRGSPVAVEANFQFPFHPTRVVTNCLQNGELQASNGRLAARALLLFERRINRRIGTDLVIQAFCPPLHAKV